MRIVWAVCVLVLAGCTAAPAGTVPKTPAASTALSASPTASGPGDEESSSDDSDATVLDVAVVGPDVAWAVGYAVPAEDEPSGGVILRMDRDGWRRVEMRLHERFPGAIYSVVSGVDAGGSDEVWAVGDIGDVDEDSRDVRLPFALRWDGQRWRTFRPAQLPKVGALTDVAVDGSRAFLIGRRGEGERSVPVLVTWDGRRFGKRDLPRGGRFHAVDAGAGHVWIAGSSSSGRCVGARPAIWHSAGRGSAPVEMRLPVSGRGTLRHIWQNGPSDVWVVGERGAAGDCDEYGTGAPLILHWNGSSWKQVAPPKWKGSLYGVAAVGEDDVWAVGYEQDVTSEVTLLHYDGRRWKRKAGYTEGGRNTFGLARVNADLLLAAGSR
ncbi:hypothetical protein E1295_20085 [Nonomuraea mesophila]|uniref:Exo-alpha-sialidase n=1 Tax=Nonomuraea mesophila TaxID=2530382 RepID=A0A4R5FG06_9ACTN|nr:hypothetical protein [Nonomuraea mesophila]TDE49947.1 hypothetical protein E1295_20085 [Nonomuraea mesophila]